MKAERDCWIIHLRSYPDRIAKREPGIVGTQNKKETGHLSFCPDKRVKTELELERNISTIAKIIVLICYPDRIVKREQGMTWNIDMMVE